MISMRLFLVILATLLCSEFSKNSPENGFIESGIAVLGLVLGFGLLAKFSAVAIVRAELRQCEALHRQRLFERFSRSRRVIEMMWIVGLPLTFLSSGWVQWTNTLAQLSCPQSFILLLLFAPSVALVALIELTAAQLESFAAEFADNHDKSNSISYDEFSDRQVVRAQTWHELWRLRLRLGEFSNLLMCLIPVFLIAICNDLLQAWSGDLSEIQLAAISTCLAITSVLLFLPAIIGKWMGVVPINDDQLSDRIDHFRRVAGIRRLDAVMIPSQGRWHGAAIVGWFPGFRKLWLGDALIHQLDAAELDMVILHELAHVKRLHFLWRSLPIVWALGLVAVYYASTALLPPDAIPFWLGRVACLLMALVTLLLGLGSVSRGCELDADREACRLAEAACDWAKNRPGKSETLMAQALRSVLAGSNEASRRAWLHPSLRERLSSLAKHLATKNSKT